MTESKTDPEQQALKAWYKKELDTVVQEMLKTKAISGAAVEAAPIWASPHKILVAKVWNATQKSQFIWTISGDAVVTDHIAGSMATNPRDVVRHFSLKWQMDADRLLSLAKSKPMVKGSVEHMQAYTEQLIGHAELLYDLSSRDNIWT